MSKKSGKAKGIGVGVVAFGAVFALFAALFHPQSLGGYVLGGILSGLAGAVIGIMGSGLDTTPHNKQPESMEKVKADTGNPEVDALLTRGREMIAQIRSENAKIPDSGLTEKLTALENKCAEIFRTVYEKPAKASQIRKFMDYYLPTSLKMVQGYRMLEERGVTGKQSEEAKQRITEALDIVLKSCDTMLANLYRDDVLDLTTDIDVLEQMLKRDGLTESDLQKAAQQARVAAQLDAEVQRRYEEAHAARATEESKAAEATPSAVSAQAAGTAQPGTSAQKVASVPQAAPAVQTPVWNSGVNERMESARQSAQNHVPGVPTMDGGIYTGGAAQAVQKAAE